MRSARPLGESPVRGVGETHWRALPVDRSTARKFSVYVPPALFDVPYVPTQGHVVAELLKLAGVGAGDVVYDLGCGDGRIVIAAARDFGATAVGIDIDPARIAEAVASAQKAGVSNRVSFKQASFFDTDVSPATVLTLYLLPEINQRLRPRLLSQLRPGTRIVANHFDMGDWRPDEHVMLGSRNLYKWIVPAPVTGHWRGVIDGPGGRRRHIKLHLERRYQFVVGAARVGRHDSEIRDGRLVGSRLHFRLRDGTRFDGTVAGNTLRGHCHPPDADHACACAWGALREH